VPNDHPHVRRLAFVVGVACAASALATGEARSDEATTASRGLIGSYVLVTRIEKPFRAVARGTLVMDGYNRATGAIRGHGFASSIPLSMTGSVHGSTITMRVVNAYGVASDVGRVYPNGTIKGRIVAKAHGLTGTVTEYGTWTMTPSIVSMEKVGLTLEHIGHQTTDAWYGIQLRNRSTGQDARKVTLDVRPLTRAGKPDQDAFILAPRISVIPAGRTVYLGAVEDGLAGNATVASLRVTVVVGSTTPKRSVLPPISNVRVDRGQGQVTGTMTNPYGRTISPYDFTASVVYYDTSGRIIGGDDRGFIGALQSRTTAIKPGQRVPVEFLIDGVSPSRVASARITVAPR
jgi:hypothetical protein